MDDSTISLPNPVGLGGVGVMVHTTYDYPHAVDELPEQDFYEESPVDPGAFPLHEPESPRYTQDQEERELLQKDINDRCTFILEQLSTGIRRWSENQDDKHDIPVLEDYKKRILIETDQERDREHPSLLHALARRWDKYHTDHPAVRNAIIHIIQHAPKNGEKEAPIWQSAILHGNLAFIEFIKKFCPAQLPEIFAMQNDIGRNFFHDVFYLAIRTNTDGHRKETSRRLTDYSSFATASILATQDKDKNTPIHYALHPQQCIGRGKGYVKLVKDMIQKADKLMERGAEFNRLGQSPFRYALINSEAQQRKKLSAPKNSTEAGNDSNSEGRQLKPSFSNESKAREKTVAANVKASLGSSKNPPLPMPGASNSRNNTFMDSPPVRSSPAAPLASSTGSRTPTLTSTNTSMPPPEIPSPGPCLQILLQHLHLHYIRERPDLVARELIYGKHACERNLHFDAGNLRNKEHNQITDLISRLSVGGFDDVLSYVRIPTIKMTSPTQSTPKKEVRSYVKRAGGTKQEPSLEENPTPGRQSLVSVFDKLYEAGVRRIIRLHVEDMDTPHHTDTAIERAIAGRDYFGLETPRRETGGRIAVETWDWQRPDLSIDVISNSASDVQHLILYWTGNQAILRGWASDEGIPRLCYPANTKSGLTKVTIRAAPGLESTERMKRSFATFTHSIEQRTKQHSTRLKIKADFQPRGLRALPSYNAANGGYLAGDRLREVVDRDKWMEAMDRFRGTLQRVHESLPERYRRPEKVKVALIDDGICLDELPAYFGPMLEASGLSFYDCGGHSVPAEPWYNSTHGHGTVMANMIARINPWVSLYAMRVHDVPSRDGSRMITPQSAAKAIRDAIGRKVNIISISWTILSKAKESGSSILANEDSGKSEEDLGLEMLREAIGEAVNAKILIFCSANDDISLKVTDFLPYQKAPEYIFRIGAADKNGRPDNVSEDFRATNFYLPGNKVASTDNPASAMSVTYHTGASVSTALAAGLASLIIYCATLGQAYYDSIGNKQRAEEFTRKREGLKMRNHMETAFHSIKFTGWNEPKFPPVWGLFGDATASISGDGEETARLEALTTLVHELSSGIR